MGMRGEIYSRKIFFSEEGKTFFFNVKENRYGDLFLNLVESNRKKDNFQRFSLVVFTEDLSDFRAELNKAMDALEQGESEYSKELSTGSGKRVYGFAVKSTRKGENYLVISESRRDSPGRFRNESIRVFDQQLTLFKDGLGQVLSFLDNKSK